MYNIFMYRLEIIHIIYIYGTPPPGPTFSHFPWYFPLVWAFPKSLFREGGVLASFQAFTNVCKHYGSIAVDLDPRSKIPARTSWIQGLDPRSKIPERTSWIQGQNIWHPRTEIRGRRRTLFENTEENGCRTGNGKTTIFFWSLSIGLCFDCLGIGRGKTREKPRTLPHQK